MNLTIYIPTLPSAIRWSKVRQTQYYTKRTKKLPKRFSFGMEGTHYWSNGKVYSKKTGQAVVKNTRTAGTPNDQSIAGNLIYAGNLHPQKRSNLVKSLKTYFIQEVMLGIKHNDLPPKPWKVSYTFIGNAKQDLDNRWLYRKVFHDAMTKLGWWEDDNVHHLSAVEEYWREGWEEDQYSLLIRITHDKHYY